MLNTADIAAELGAILRGEAPGWEGDRRANGGLFLRRIRSDFPPSDVAILAEDLHRNAVTIATDIAGAPSPLSLLMAARVLNKQAEDM